MSSTRESRATRNKREKAQKRLLRSVGFDPSDPDHLRFDLESTEFALLFTVEGGRESIGPGTVLAMNSLGQKVDSAIAPRLQSLDRGTVAIMSSLWEDVEAIAEVREKIREDRSQMQYHKLMKAREDRANVFCRQDVPDQIQRSIFIGSNYGPPPSDPEESHVELDPTVETCRAVVTYKVDDHYVIDMETWNGGWSEPDENGQRERLGVTPDIVEGVTFYSAQEAQEAFLLAVDEKDENYKEFHHLASGERWIKRGEKLRAWANGDGKDLKAFYRQPSKPKKQKQDSGACKGTWQRK